MIYWFIMINASVIVLFPTILVAMVMVIALRNDIQRYNAEVYNRLYLEAF